MPVNTTFDEKALLRAIAQGNEDAFAQLYLRYYDRIFSVGLVYLKVREMAEDTVQQVFLKLWEKRSTITSIQNIESYLFIAARNEIYNVFRRQQVSETYREFVRELFAEEPGSPEDLLIMRQQALILETAVSNLPERQQQAFRLSREKGLRHAEIAEIMNISVSTVKEHIAGATRHIKTYLSKHKDELLAIIMIMMNSR